MLQVGPGVLCFDSSQGRDLFGPPIRMVRDAIAGLVIDCLTSIQKVEWMIPHLPCGHVPIVERCRSPTNAWSRCQFPSSEWKFALVFVSDSLLSED
jgi:hypothetical protein